MSSERAQVHIYPQDRYEGGAFNYNQPQNRYYNEGGAKLFGENGPSASQILALIIGLPIGGTLLALSGLSLIGSLIGLAVATPLFILFSPILVQAAITIALAVAGILLSGACGLTALASFSWVVNYIKQTHESLSEQLDRVKYRTADTVEYMGQKTKETGQDVKNKAHDAKRT